MWYLGTVYIGSSYGWCLMALGALSAPHQARGQGSSGISVVWSTRPSPYKKIITCFSIWLSLILGRALMLKNAKLRSQTFEIASWSGAQKLPMALRLCRDIRSGGDKQASPFIVGEPEAEIVPERSGHVVENLPKMFKVVGGILKSIQWVWTG